MSALPVAFAAREARTAPAETTTAARIIKNAIQNVWSGSEAFCGGVVGDADALFPGDATAAVEATGAGRVLSGPAPCDAEAAGWSGSRGASTGGGAGWVSWQ